MSNSLKLDRTKDFASVIGDDQGRVYEQGHHFFRADGSLWHDPHKPAPKETQEQRIAREKAEADEAKRVQAEADANKAAGGADDQLSKQLGT